MAADKKPDLYCSFLKMSDEALVTDRSSILTILNQLPTDGPMGVRVSIARTMQQNRVRLENVCKEFVRVVNENGEEVQAEGDPCARCAPLSARFAEIQIILDQIKDVCDENRRAMALVLHSFNTTAFVMNKIANHSKTSELDPDIKKLHDEYSKDQREYQRSRNNDGYSGGNGGYSGGNGGYRGGYSRGGGSGASRHSGGGKMRGGRNNNGNQPPRKNAYSAFEAAREFCRDRHDGNLPPGICFLCDGKDHRMEACKTPDKYGFLSGRK